MKKHQERVSALNQEETMHKLYVTIFFSFSVITPITWADVAGDLGGFFTALGYNGNITPATAYQGQAAGYYSGGSAVLRNRVKNIQIMHVDLPSIRAGCGGIDMFTGGFSFINAEQLTSFFQTVMSNAAGYMFNLALETVVPEIAHSMQYIQNLAREINSLDMNSCEMAVNLAGGLLPRMQATQQHICKDIGAHKNAFSDWAEARQKCKSPSDYSKQMDEASTDPQYKARSIYNKNLIWDALLKHGFFSGRGDELAEFFMSLSGTVIYNKEGHAAVYNPLATDQNVLSALLKGGEATIYRCGSDAGCLKPTKGKIKINEENALYTKIGKSINSLVSAVQNEASGSPGLSNELKGFLELTKLPILKFITTQLMAGNAAMASNVSSYAESIAKNLLIQYLQEALHIVKESLSGTDYNPEIHKQLIDQIHQAQTIVQAIKTESRYDIQELMSFIDSSKSAEQELMSRVTGQIKDNLGVKP